MTDWRFIRRLYGRRILRFFRAYLLLFAVHRLFFVQRYKKNIEIFGILGKYYEFCTLLIYFLFHERKN